MVLLNAQITHGMACSPQGRQQLGPVVLQGLSPLRMGRPDGQNPAFEPQGTAVRRQPFSGDPGPVLPEARKIPVLPPVLLQSLEAALQLRSWGRRGCLKELQSLEPAALRIGSDGHLHRLGGCFCGSR